MKHTLTNKDILQTQDMSYKVKQGAIIRYFDSISESLSTRVKISNYI